MDSREGLLREFFDARGNHNPEEVKIVEGKLHTYIKTYGDDFQINDLLRLSNVAKIEREHNDYEKSEEILSPTLKRIANSNNLNKWDIRILAASIGHIENFNDIQSIYEKSFLKGLEEHYSNKPEYDNVKVAFSYNAVGRLLRAKYFEMDKQEPTKKLIDLFEFQFAILQDIFKDTEKFQVFEAVILVRKGLFYDDNIMVDGGLKMLKTHDKEGELYTLLKEECLECYLYVSLDLNKQRFYEMLSENIRNERISRRLTQEELANLVKIDPSTISQIERRQKNISVSTLFNIARVFNMSVEQLVGLKISDVQSEEDLKNQQFILLFNCLTESEKAFVITIIKGLVGLNTHRKDTPFEIFRPEAFAE